MRRVASCFVVALGVTGAAAAGDLEQRAADSRAVAQQFMQKLKGELQAAMKAGGPVQAIGVCNVRAPEIAQAMSERTGWEVGRTSLKARNANNAPDAWERGVLERFEQRKAVGADPEALEHYEVVQSGDQRYFRYMKAIPTGGVCLSCHGQRISQPVEAKLERLYPNDRARGYELGDIRGAFTITQPLD